MRRPTVLPRSNEVTGTTPGFSAGERSGFAQSVGAQQTRNIAKCASCDKKGQVEEECERAPVYINLAA